MKHVMMLIGLAAIVGIVAGLELFVALLILKAPLNAIDMREYSSTDFFPAIFVVAGPIAIGWFATWQRERFTGLGGTGLTLLLGVDAAVVASAIAFGLTAAATDPMIQFSRILIVVSAVLMVLAALATDWVDG